MGKDNRFATSLREVNTILRQPLDDGMFSVLSFKADQGDIRIWPGLRYEEDPKPAPPGWAHLPDADAVKSANEFLNGIHCNDYTDLGSGIRKAFELNVHREKLTLIIFTDGNNTYPDFEGKRPTQVVAYIKALQKTRTDRRKDKIRIFIFGVSAEQNVVMLSAIAKNNGGGYLTTDRVCSECLKNKDNKPEVQQIHRFRHILPDHPDYDADLRGFEDESDDDDEAPDYPGPDGPTPY
jgi:hypothetical protein